MTPQCSICQHPESAAIGASLAAGEPYRSIAATHGVSLGALSRHVKRCLAPAKPPASPYDDLLASARAALANAERSGDAKAVNDAARTLAAVLKMERPDEPAKPTAPSTSKHSGSGCPACGHVKGGLTPEMAESIKRQVLGITPELEAGMRRPTTARPLITGDFPEVRQPNGAVGERRNVREPGDERPIELRPGVPAEDVLPRSVLDRIGARVDRTRMDVLDVNSGVDPLADHEPDPDDDEPEPWDHTPRKR